MCWGLDRVELSEKEFRELSVLRLFHLFPTRTCQVTTECCVCAQPCVTCWPGAAGCPRCCCHHRCEDRGAPGEETEGRQCPAGAPRWSVCSEGTGWTGQAKRHVGPVNLRKQRGPALQSVGCVAWRQLLEHFPGLLDLPQGQAKGRRTQKRESRAGGRARWKEGRRSQRSDFI